MRSRVVGNCPAEATAVVCEPEEQISDTAVGGYRKERWMLALSGTYSEMPEAYSSCEWLVAVVPGSLCFL